MVSINDFDPNPDNPPLVEAMKIAAAVFRTLDIPYALTGGFAVYARGGAMIVDHDVDFLIKPNNIDLALEGLERENFKTSIPPEGWLVKSYYEDEHLVDLIHSPHNESVTDDTLEDVTIMQVWGQHMPVYSATGLMIHKLLSFGVHYCDFSPVLLMARALAPDVDWERVYRCCEHNPYAKSFLSLVKDLGLRT